MQNLKRLGESYVTAPGLRAWHVGEVDPALRFVTPPTNDPAVVERWRPASTSRLAVDTERSRLIAVCFDTPDDRQRLEDRLGYSLDKSRMSDQTVVLRMPGSATEFPTFSSIAPGAYVQSAWSPLVVPESALEWLDDPRFLERVPTAPPSLLKLVDPRAMTTDRWKKYV
jgi:hypothetical protein